MLPLVRKIASNLLFDGHTLHRNPLVELSDEGEVLRVTIVEHPDSEAFTEFYAGMLVVGLDPAMLPQLITDHTTSLHELLPQKIDPARGRLTLLTGLDYTLLRFTTESRYTIL